MPPTIPLVSPTQRRKMIGMISVILAFVSMLLSNLLCLALGGAWLATVIGVGPAIGSGVTPFLLGSLLKSILGAAILKATVRDRGQAAQ